MQRIQKCKGYAIGIFSPFIILLTIVLLLLLLNSTSAEVNFGRNTISFTGLGIISFGVIIGLASLLQSSQIKVWWRVLIFVLYIPTVLFSLLLVGL